MEEVAAKKLAEAITAAQGAINALPAVDHLTLEDAESVKSARALVDLVLTLDGNAEVEGIDVLVALEEKMVELLAEKEATERLEKAIADAEVVITNLPEKITIIDKQKVEDARALRERNSRY